MSTSIIKFDYLNGAEVRAIKDEKGEPWFVAKDVCNALELDNISMSTSKLDEDEKGINIIYTLGGAQSMLTINESGLYHLVILSRKPEAKKFRKWVTSEVLPTIRKTGEYKLIRSESKQIRNTFTDSLKQHEVVDNIDYMKLTATMKKNLGINGHKKKEDMTASELKKLSVAENITSIKIEQDNIVGYDNIKAEARVVCHTLSGLLNKGEN